MIEVTVYKVIEEKQVVVSPDCVEYYHFRDQDSDDINRIYNSHEFVYGISELVRLPITKYTKNKAGIQHCMYVAYDKSFDNLVAMYTTATPDVTAKVVKESQDYRDKWLKVSAEHQRMNKMYWDEVDKRNKVSNKVLKFNKLGFWKKLWFVIIGDKL